MKMQWGEAKKKKKKRERETVEIGGWGNQKAIYIYIF